MSIPFFIAQERHEMRPMHEAGQLPAASNAAIMHAATSHMHQYQQTGWCQTLFN